MTTPTLAARRALAVVAALATLASAPAEAQRAHAAAATPPWAPGLATAAASRPSAALFATAETPEALRAHASASGSKRGLALLMIGAGIGLIYGGREVEDAAGFPGAVMRFTGIAGVGGGLLFSCGCL